MCTAITFGKQNQFFGRNLDLPYHYEESVCIMPRRFPLLYRHLHTDCDHYAMIGMATVKDGYPLYYDGTNEHGLCIAALQFRGNAYLPTAFCGEAVAQFELIPYLLSRCKNIQEARALLDAVTVADIPFDSDMPSAALHYILCDRDTCIVVEPMKDGVHIEENALGVLTNNPPFPLQLHYLSHFLNLTTEIPENRFSEKIGLTHDSHGMGAIGLPGDCSSQSRFVRAAFCKLNAREKDSAEKNLRQCFHILGAVSQIEGCVRTEHGDERTQYTGIVDTHSKSYTYTTYDCGAAKSVFMKDHDLDGEILSLYPLF